MCIIHCCLFLFIYLFVCLFSLSTFTPAVAAALAAGASCVHIAQADICYGLKVKTDDRYLTFHTVTDTGDHNS